MHVRHGDSCLNRERKRMARTCTPMSAYIAEARKMKRRCAHCTANSVCWIQTARMQQTCIMVTLY
jgi:hypothetical protein